ncbi:CHAT domain-containing protein [Bacteroides sp. OttesenSCG-928-J23]|nr:CHAT domain-containing protein [Bacteroides sp. OttesenSCG-928-J23]MDL2304986.1 CHAT domain-containing protein [Bacteroides sp. OttesenSCG-928-D19]
MKKILIIVLISGFWHHAKCQEASAVDTIINTFNTGLEYYSVQNFSESLNVFTQCWDMLMQANLPEEETVELHLTLCYVLGNTYCEVGEYQLSEKFYLQGINFAKKHQEENNQLYRFCLSGCLLLYTNLKDYEKALEYGTMAKYYYEVNKELQVEYASFLYNMGLLFIKWGKISEAKAFVSTAKNIYSRNSSETDLRYFSMLNALATLYTEIGEYELSNKTCRESIEFCEKNGMTQSREYGISLCQIGLNCYWQNEYKQAEEYLNKSLEVLEPLLGVNHQICLTIYSNLAFTYIASKDDRLYDLAKKISEIEKQNIDSYFQFLSVEQRESYWDRGWTGFNFAYMAALNRPSPQTNALLYNNVLYMQGLLLKSQNATRKLILDSQDQELIRNYNSLTSLYEQRSKKTSSATQDSLKMAIEGLEKLIAGKVPQHLQKEYNWEDILLSLNRKEAAVEFLALPVLNANRNYPVMYSALVVRGDSKHPELVPLCMDKELKSLIAIDSLVTRKYVNKLYNSNVKADSIGYKLYEKLWKPLEKHLSGTNTVYYSLSDVLGRISFQALPTEKGRLIDVYNLHQVSSTAEIPLLKKRQKSTIATAAIYGGITYDAHTDSLLLATRQYYTSDNLAEAFFRDENPERKGWDYLKWTSTEAEAICTELSKKKIKHNKYLHHYANEESFKALNNAPVDVIHLATHGYYLSDTEKIASNKFLQNQEGIRRDVMLDKMLRSGLLMAGANRAWMGKNIIPGIEDGILTAEEITRVNLSQTKLVVLSACNTGLGDTSILEGTYGLQRAFKLAGVESIIMSLWSVPDEITCRLMIEFYKKWLSGKKTKQQALREAQQYIRKQQPEPYYWAGFVVLD